MRKDQASPSRPVAALDGVVGRLQRWFAGQRSDSVRLLLLLAAAILLAVTTQLAIDLISALLRWFAGVEGDPIHPWLWTAALVVFGLLYLVAGLMVASALVRLVRPVARIEEIGPANFRPRPVLVLPISDLNSELGLLREFVEGWEGGRLPKDPGAVDERMRPALKSNWVPPLLSIEAQLPALRRVYLVGSGGAERSSQRELAVFVEVASRMLARRAANGLPEAQVDFVVAREDGPDLVIPRAAEKPAEGAPAAPWQEHGVDFNSYQRLLETFSLAIGRAIRAGFRPDQICLDVTAGTKPVSIAGAVVTLNREVVLSYVTFAKDLVFNDGRLTREYGLSELGPD